MEQRIFHLNFFFHNTVHHNVKSLTISIRI